MGSVVGQRYHLLGWWPGASLYRGSLSLDLPEKSQSCFAVCATRIEGVFLTAVRIAAPP